MVKIIVYFKILAIKNKFSLIKILPTRMNKCYLAIQIITIKIKIFLEYKILKTKVKIYLKIKIKINSNIIYNLILQITFHKQTVKVYL